MSTPDLVVCGSLTIDNVVTADGTRLPRSAGGNVAYAALGAALWGGSVGLVSRAGADYPADFLAMLAARGLDLGGIARIDAPHGMNVAFAYSADGSRVRAFPADLMARIPAEERPRFVDYGTLGTAHRYATWLAFAPDAADVPSGWVARFRAAHLAAMPVQRHLSLVGHLRAARPDCGLQVDSPWYDEREPAADFHTSLLERIDLLLPSEADLETWRPGIPALQSAASLARHSGRPILVKRGAQGCLLVTPDGGPAFRVPAFAVDAVDPTGAGDSFCGGVLAGMQRYGNLQNALICGSVTASFTVAAPGLEGLLRASPAEAERRFDWIARNTTWMPDPKETNP